MQRKLEKTPVRNQNNTAIGGGVPHLRKKREKKMFYISIRCASFISEWGSVDKNTSFL